MTLTDKEINLLFCVLRGSFKSKRNMANSKRSKQSLSPDVVSPLFTALITFLMSSLENMIDTIMAKHVEGLFALLRNFFEAAKHMEENQRLGDADEEDEVDVDDDDEEHQVKNKLTRQPPVNLNLGSKQRGVGGKRQRPASTKQHDLEPPLKKSKTARGKAQPAPMINTESTHDEVDEVDLSRCPLTTKMDKAKEAFMSSTFDMPDLSMAF